MRNHPDLNTDKRYVSIMISTKRKYWREFKRIKTSMLEQFPLVGMIIDDDADGSRDRLAHFIVEDTQDWPLIEQAARCSLECEMYRHFVKGEDPKEHIVFSLPFKYCSFNGYWMQD